MVLEQMREYERSHVLEQVEYQKERMRLKCQRLSQKVHHLISTKSIQGILSNKNLNKKSVQGQ